MKPLLLCSLLALLLVPHIALANEGLKVAVVDVDKILNVSKAGQSIQKQLKERREAFQKEFSTREKKLMQSEKELVQQKSSLTAEEFSKKREAFQKQLLETRKLFQKSRSSLDKGLGQAMANLRKNVIQVTAEIADENSYVSYLEGCTAPQYDNNQLHAAVVELIALKNATMRHYFTLYVDVIFCKGFYAAFQPRYALRYHYCFGSQR